MILTIITYVFGLISGIIITAVILTDWRNIGKPVDFRNCGKALDFDGVNDYIDLDYAAFNSLLSGFSFG